MANTTSLEKRIHKRLKALNFPKLDELSLLKNLYRSAHSNKFKRGFIKMDFAKISIILLIDLSINLKKGAFEVITDNKCIIPFIRLFCK